MNRCNPRPVELDPATRRELEQARRRRKLGPYVYLQEPYKLPEYVPPDHRASKRESKPRMQRPSREASCEGCGKTFETRRHENLPAWCATCLPPGKRMDAFSGRRKGA